MFLFLRPCCLGFRLLLCVLLASPVLVAASNPAPEQANDGITLARDGIFLKVQVVSDQIIRVVRSKDKNFCAHPSLMLAGPLPPAPAWRLEATPGFAILHTAKLQVRVNLASGDVTFLNPSGLSILAEAPGSRQLQPAEVQGARTLHVRQAWSAAAGESLYGLGSNQLGLLDLKGHDLDLWQHNGTVAVPFLVSSRGYGLLWDNNSYTRFGDLRQTEPIPASQLFDVHGRPGGLTATYFAGADFAKPVDQRIESDIDLAIPDAVDLPNHKINPALPATGFCSVRWEGEVVPKESGLYTFETFSNAGIKLWIDDQLVMNHWRQGWLPWFEVAQVQLEKGRHHRIKMEWSRDERMPTIRLRWKTPSADPATSLWSQVGDGIDYYFVYGPKMDDVVGGYRQLTGTAPLMPVWAFGLWQSRERYETAQASLDVVKEFRRRGIPFDNIVQDWRYWPDGKWGSHEFDPVRFPDPDGWIRSLHAEHARLMISVWGKYYPGTANFEAMHSHGYLYDRNLKEGTTDWLGYNYTFYDAFNPGARTMLWDQMNRQLFRRGVDAWWMDATEPDLRPTPTLDGQRDYATPTALGPGSRELNAYPLLNSEAVYDGQRSVAPDQRVFILTRSGYAGQQRYAAATWSGDISSTWTAMRKQIPLGLSFCLSGLPYWTMDSGGFAVPERFAAKNPKPADLEEWRELNTRWFEFAAFVPLLRVHGQLPFREMWNVGPDASPAYQAQLRFDRLRYRLLPYVYSVAGAVTRQHGTFMRALVMDFADDPQTHAIGDQYMFGPAFLVNPVTTYQARSRPVYLPVNDGGWFDFWSGVAVAGGQRIDAPAPFDEMPLYVRAGSIVPFGPEIQYTQEKPADPITLFVYAGADANFNLYEDDGLTYDYQKGACSVIPLHWNNTTRTLIVGARTGSFPGMLAERTFDVVLVSKDKPVGFSFASRADQTVKYHGDAVEVQLP